MHIKKLKAMIDVNKIVGFEDQKVHFVSWWGKEMPVILSMSVGKK
jgi:hypothetical protein